MHTLGKGAGGKLPQEFESLILRQNKKSAFKINIQSMDFPITRLILGLLLLLYLVLSIRIILDRKKLNINL